MLQSIAAQGIVPLFAHWANTSYLVDYVKAVTKTAPLERIQFEAVESKESYTWPWKTLLELRRELNSLTGLAHISLDGLDGDELLVEFTQDKVTVATVWGTPEIRCHGLNREEWTDHLLELITGREPETYGKVFNLSKESVDKMKGPVSFSSVTIFLLK